MLLGPMPQKIHKEIIFPLSFSAGPGLDICHVDVISFEYIEHFSQGAGFMRSAE
jgi:hypothetical protein